MRERVLTLRELNRTTLLRQMLLRRAQVGVVTAVERLGGLQAQEPRSPYVSLWSRVDGFRRDALERAIVRGSVVKATLMRLTQHLVSRRDHELLVAALDAAWRRGDPVDASVESLVARAAERPLAWAEVTSFLQRELGTHAARDFRLARLGVLARLRQEPKHALWSARRARTYVASPVNGSAAAPGREHVVRRYLGAFGPASRGDLAQWSGVSVAQLEQTLDGMRLRTFRDETGRTLLDLPRAPLAPADSIAPPRLLPWFDELVVAYDRRERVLPDEHRAPIIHGGIVYASFLIDGFFAGRWRLDRGRVVLEPLARLTRTQRAELDDEARRLEAFVR